MNENSVHPTDEREARLVKQLRAWAGVIQPRPQFATQLEANLLARWKSISVPVAPRKTINPTNPKRRQPMLKRLFLALAAVAAVLVLALVLPALFGGDHDLPPLPRLVSAAGPGSQPMPQGLLAGADLTLITDLPEAPAEVPVYRIATTPFPATSEEALAWARDFGLPDPKVYRDPREPEAIFVLGDDGQQLTFRQFGPMGSIDYGNERAAAATEGTPLSFDQAAEVAVSFLREHDLLPAAYRIQESEHFAPRPENPIRFVHIVPELGGHPLAGYRSGAQVAVNPAGQVTYASFNPLTFEQNGNYPIKSAQEAYDELSGGQVAGSPFRLDTDVRYSAEMDVQHYSPPPPAWSIGQPVILTGWVHVLVAEDGSDVRAELMARGGTQYDLTGPRLAELANVGFDDVQIKGTVVAQVGEHRWQVEVADWETIPQRQPHCLVGTFTLDEDGAWLVTDGGERYRLPNAPDELSDGQRIEVCADERPADGGDVDWWSIVSPPMSEDEGYVGSSSSSVSVVVESSVEEPLPPTQAETIFEIGQSVEVTGVVHATIFVSGESRRVEAWLDVDELGEEQPPYPLSGSPDVLEAIAQLDYLHAHVRGRVVTSGQEWAPGGLGIEIEDFEKVWPDERVQGFLGHIDLETLEGREVAVFTDHETDQRYVLAPSLEVEGYWTAGRDPMLDSEQIFMAGLVHPANTYGGLPILQPVSSRYGRETEAATSADQFPLEVGPSVVDEAAMMGPGGLQGAFVVDRVELAYYYEPQPGYVARSTDGPPLTQEPAEMIIQPAWVFYGHNADDTVRFIAYVQAVVEEHVQNATP
ncbi:MAG TPA: hypothetical protein ENI37_09365 [Chloroflexi bacterium]|nr:hypothetical protein [Chloroflexota bacterium]